MGLGHFLDGVGDAVTNVAKGAAYVANPTHLDDIARGVGKTAEFVAEHPGQTAHIAGEVGKGILKDQLKPQNLIINAALLGATALTGGAAAPALIAKLGLGAKTVEAGVTAAKVGETVGEVAKGVNTGVKALDVATDVAKAADTAGDIAKGVEAAGEAGSAASKLAKAGKVAEKVLGGSAKESTTLSKVMNPIGELRGAAARKIMAGGGEAPSLARQATAATVQGLGKRAPTQLAGMSDEVYGAQKAAWAGQRAITRGNQIGQAEKATEVAADPMGAVEDRAAKEINARAYQSNYTDRGQTAESLYSPKSDPGDDVDRGQLALPSAGQTANQAGASQVNDSMYSAPKVDFSQGYNGKSNQRGSNFQPPATPPTAMASGSSPGGPPSGGGGNGGGGGGNSNSNSSNSSSSTGGGPGVHTVANQSDQNFYSVQAGGRGQPFYQGPRSQWAGGISSHYDWRPIDPLRAINVFPHKSGSRTANRGGPKGPGEEGSSDNNEQGAPDSFSPEVNKDGTVAASQGQDPNGPRAIEPGEWAGGRRDNVNVKQPAGRPAGAIQRGTNILDADVISDSWDATMPAIAAAPKALMPGSTPAFTPLKQPGSGGPVMGSRTARRGGLPDNVISNSIAQSANSSNNAAGMVGQQSAGSPPGSFNFGMGDTSTRSGGYTPLNSGASEWTPNMPLHGPGKRISI